MIIKIVCAGDEAFGKIYREEPDEFLLGVDGGIHSILRAGKIPDLALGDFDSVDIRSVSAFCHTIRIYPQMKDEGDLELAIREIADWPAERISIYNATGGRIDHFLAAINLLLRYSHLPLEIIDLRNRICLLDDGSIILPSSYRYCSFFAISEDTVISLSGFKYELSNYRLHPTDNLCLSNEVLSEGLVRTNKKLLLVQSF
jgi:thiamine pyrophosphokinase